MVLSPNCKVTVKRTQRKPVFICLAEATSRKSSAKVQLLSETQKDFAKIVLTFLFFEIECLFLRLKESINNLNIVTKWLITKN